MEGMVTEAACTHAERAVSCCTEAVQGSTPRHDGKAARRRGGEAFISCLIAGHSAHVDEPFLDAVVDYDCGQRVRVLEHQHLWREEAGVHQGLTARE